MIVIVSFIVCMHLAAPLNAWPMPGSARSAGSTPHASTGTKTTSLSGLCKSGGNNNADEQQRDE